ncbi:UNVERIFIED_CONTAM: hypothetical protein HDU68_007391 [Siphonaria sp. JEL0065]|nr:hypothetical protein HDU68_007391 [Siphonaria sp. JEL0065]
MLSTLKSLVRREREASTENAAITDLIKCRLVSLRTGLGGRIIVQLDLTLQGSQQQQHAFRTGDSVALLDSSSSTCTTKSKTAANATTTSKTSILGVIHKSTRSEVSVAINEDSSDVDPSMDSWSIGKIASDSTFKRMEAALDSVDVALKKLEGSLDSASIPASVSVVNSALLDVLLRGTRPCFDDTNRESGFAFFDDALNDSQKCAVTKSLAADSIALIHGPPGTGKTQTVIELVRQLVSRKNKVLLCGPSNISVDTLADRLLNHVGPGLQFTRIGHPSRVRRERVLGYTLDLRVKSCDEGVIANDVRNEMDETLSKIQKCKRKGDRRVLYDDMKRLRAELRVREKKVVHDIIVSSHVVLATLSGCGSCVLKDHSFDAIVIDESSQAMEPESWIAILKGSPNARLYLAGDHLQLPPTVKSLSSKTFQQPVVTTTAGDVVTTTTPNSLTYTLFDRLLATYGDSIKIMLTTQYRMNTLIMQPSSAHLYNSLLQAHPSVATHLLSDLPNVESTPETTSPFTFLNTSLCDYYETTPDPSPSNSQKKSESLQNRGEVTIVEQHVAKLVSAGVPIKDISIITPYSAQVSLLQTLLYPTYPTLEIGTVDSFQGAEKEAIILSLVRSNELGELGFLGDERRLNVAVTRARRHLCVVGDERIKRGSRFLERLVKVVEDEGGDMVYVE